MNLNKQAPKGIILLTVSALFLLASAYLLATGTTTIQSDDGSGLGNFLGQSTLFLAGITILITIATGIMGIKRFKNSRQILS